MKYGIKVPVSLDNHGEYTDWLWVVDMNLKPKLYDSYESAHKDTVFWGPNAKVEEHGESKDSY